MGAFHIATLRSLPQVEEVRVFDVDPARRSHPTLEAALEGAGLAVIVSPSSTHAELIGVCVERGLPVFCEKPIDVDLEVTRSVVARVEAAGGTVQIGFQRRFDAAFGAVREAVRGGAVGRVQSFAMSTCDRQPPPISYLPGSGGLFRDLHIHDFDSLRWLFGQEVEEVFAAGSVLVDQGFADHGDVDTAGLVLRFEDGMVGTLAGGRLNPGGYIARLDVHGSRDMACVREDRTYQDFLDRYPAAYRAEIEHFLLVARAEAAPAATVRDGLEAMRIAEAADRSRRERRPVRMSEIAGVPACTGP